MEQLLFANVNAHHYHPRHFSDDWLQDANGLSLRETAKPVGKTPGLRCVRPSRAGKCGRCAKLNKPCFAVPEEFSSALADVQRVDLDFLRGESPHSSQGGGGDLHDGV